MLELHQLNDGELFQFKVDPNSLYVVNSIHMEDDNCIVMKVAILNNKKWQFLREPHITAGNPYANIIRYSICMSQSNEQK